MGKKGTSGTGAAKQPAAAKGRPSALLDTRIVYCGDNLEQLSKLPDAWLQRAKSSRVDPIYIDPAPVSEAELPFNSNRNHEVFWSETKEKRAFEDRHASNQAYIDYMRPRCVQLTRVLKKTGSFYYHCDWHASYYAKMIREDEHAETCPEWQHPSARISFQCEMQTT